MRKHFSSLRSQMTLLTTGTVLAVVILATVFYSSAQRMSEKKAATFVHSMLVQLGDSLDRIGNEMSYLGNALHSNEVFAAVLSRADSDTTNAVRQKFH